MTAAVDRILLHQQPIKDVLDELHGDVAAALRAAPASGGGPRGDQVTITQPLT